MTHDYHFCVFIFLFTYYCCMVEMSEKLCATDIHLSNTLCVDTQQLSVPLFNVVYTSSLVMYSL